MPASLKEELEALAKANRRSLTAEIVARLERSVSDMDELGISDRDRLNYDGESPIAAAKRVKAPTKIQPKTPRENVFLAAMLEAFRGIEDLPPSASLPFEKPANDKNPPEDDS